jgi:putative transposase
MSRVERRALVERAAPALPVSRQCRLLSVSRASVYRRPAEISEEDCTIMALIDRQYLARPYYGSRRMAAWLATQGHVVNRKRALEEALFRYGRPEIFNTDQGSQGGFKRLSQHHDEVGCDDHSKAAIGSIC